MDTKAEGDGMNWETGIGTYALLCMKQITHDCPLYITENFAQCSVVT